MSHRPITKQLVQLWPFFTSVFFHIHRCSRLLQPHALTTPLATSFVYVLPFCGPGRDGEREREPREASVRLTEIRDDRWLRRRRGQPAWFCARPPGALNRPACSESLRGVPSGRAVPSHRSCLFAHCAQSSELLVMRPQCFFCQTVSH